MPKGIARNPKTDRRRKRNTRKYTTRAKTKHTGTDLAPTHTDALTLAALAIQIDDAQTDLMRQLRAFGHRNGL